MRRDGTSSPALMPYLVPRNAIVVARPCLVSAALDHETVILHPDRGIYFGLNEIGTRVWDSLGSPTTPRDLAQTLHSEYEVEPEVLASDLDAFLGKLAEQGLIDVRDADGP